MRRAIHFAKVLVLGFLAMIPSPGSAHQKWLWPNRFEFEKSPVSVSFDVTWSDRPFEAESGVNDRPLTVVDPDGRASGPARALVGKTKSTAEADLPQPGTYRLESTDPLAYWTQVEKDGQTKWLKQAKGQAADGKVVRTDLYWSKALAYVIVEKASQPLHPEADPLAIVPEGHPNELSVGNPLAFKVLSFGKPVAHAELKLFNEETVGHEPAKSIKCNAEGMASVQFDAPGRYLVTCQLERNVKDDPKADIHSFNVYLTLRVLPDAKTP